MGWGWYKICSTVEFSGYAHDNSAPGLVGRAVETIPYRGRVCFEGDDDAADVVAARLRDGSHQFCRPENLITLIDGRRFRCEKVVTIGPAEVTTIRGFWAELLHRIFN